MQFIKSKDEKILVLTSFSVLLLYIYLNGGMALHPDSNMYIEIIQSLSSGENYYNNYDPSVTLLRPLMYYLALPFYLLLGDASHSLTLLNSLFYILSVLFFYRYVLILFKDQRLAFLSSLYFLSSFPILYWGLSILPEMGSWFFVIFLLYNLEGFDVSVRSRTNFLIFLAIGLSILYKTNLVVIPLFIFLMLFSNFGFKNFPYYDFFLFGIFISIPVFLNQVFVWYYFDINYYDDFLRESLFFWEKDATASNYEGELYSSEYQFKYTQTYRTLTFFIAFPFLFPFFFLGLYRIKEDNFELYKYSRLYLISALIIILGWSSSLEYIGAGSPRYAFLLFPLVIPLMIIGFDVSLEYALKNQSFIYPHKDKFVTFFIFSYMLISLIMSLFDKEVRLSLNLWV